MNANLTRRLGERILRGAGRDFKEVAHVDFGYDYSRGWSEYTPPDSSCSVLVHYDGKTYDKYYNHLGIIIKELEDITEEIQDEAYE